MLFLHLILSFFLPLFFICAGGWSSARSRRALDDTSRALSPLINRYYKILLQGAPCYTGLTDGLSARRNSYLAYQQTLCLCTVGRKRIEAGTEREREREQLGSQSIQHAARATHSRSSCLTPPRSHVVLCVLKFSGPFHFSRRLLCDNGAAARLGKAHIQLNHIVDIL